MTFSVVQVTYGAERNEVVWSGVVWCVPGNKLKYKIKRNKAMKTEMSLLHNFWSSPGCYFGPSNIIRWILNGEWLNTVNTVKNTETQKWYKIKRRNTVWHAHNHWHRTTAIEGILIDMSSTYVTSFVLCRRFKSAQLNRKSWFLRFNALRRILDYCCWFYFVRIAFLYLVFVSSVRKCDSVHILLCVF